MANSQKFVITAQIEVAAESERKALELVGQALKTAAAWGNGYRVDPHEPGHPDGKVQIWNVHESSDDHPRLSQATR